MTSLSCSSAEGSYNSTRLFRFFTTTATTIIIVSTTITNRPPPTATILASIPILNDELFFVVVGLAVVAEEQDSLVHVTPILLTDTDMDSSIALMLLCTPVPVDDCESTYVNVCEKKLLGTLRGIIESLQTTWVSFKSSPVTSHVLS